MRKPVSHIFHGRNIFTPAAAYLSKGVKIEEFGKKLNPKNLVKAPYDEAVMQNSQFNAKIISINKFGSLHLNIMHKEWDKLKIKIGDFVEFTHKNNSIKIQHGSTFGDVEKGKPLILKDDYGRIELAINMENFSKKYNAEIGDNCIIKKSN